MNEETVVVGPAQGAAGFMANLLQTAAQNAPTIPNEILPRYGMSFLLPLPLLNQKASNFIGDFNPKIDPKNPQKGNAENINYYPAFELIAFYGGTTDQPFERLPTFTNEIPTPEPFDYGSFNASAQAGTSILDRTPKACADIALMEFKEFGYKQFNSLTGFHFTDPDKGLSAIYRILNVILPVQDSKIFPRGDEYARVKNGVRFEAPFLDQMYDFVTHHSLKRIEQSGWKEESKIVARKFFAEIRDGVSSAIKMANTILNETEAEMKNPKGVKKSYDEPNLLIEDAPVPTDLYCLAHTNRTELDDKQLQAGANIGKEIAASVIEGFREINADNKSGGSNQSKRPANMPKDKDVLTGDEVQVMLEKQREEMEERFASQIGALTQVLENLTPETLAAIMAGSRTGSADGAGNLQNDSTAGSGQGNKRASGGSKKNQSDQAE